MVPHGRVLGGKKEKLTRKDRIGKLVGEVVERALKGSTGH